MKVDLEHPGAADTVVANRALWDRVVMNVSTMHMPPDGAPQPTKAQRADMVTWLQTTLSGNCKIKDPGHVTMRRLNRREYNNTVRDLTGLDLHLSDDFPSDDVGYGFDNIGDVLSISPLLMEKYLKAAEVISQRAIVVPDNRSKKYDAENLKFTSGVTSREPNQIYFFSNGQAYFDSYFTMAGDYRVRAIAYGEQAGPEPAKMAFMVDNQPVKTFEIKAVAKQPE